MAKKTRTIKTSKELNASVENSCAYAGFHPQMGWQPQRVNLQTMTTCQFFDEFIATRTPCIITSTLPGNINNWTSEYLCESAGHEQVQVEIRDAHGNFGSSQKRLHMTFAEFIDKLQSDDSANYYLTTQYDDSEISNQNKYNHTNVEKCHNLRQNETFRDTYPAPIPSLLNDIPMCPSIFKTLALQQINLWIGSSPSEIHGTTSGLHHDFADNLYILLRGRKRFTIFSPKDASAMYLHGDIDTMKTYNKKRKQYHKNKGQDGMHVHPNGLISYALGIQSDGAHICDVVNWRLEQTQNIYSKLQLEMQKESKSTLSDTQQDALMELENKIEQLEDELLRLQQIYGGDDLVDDFEMELDNSSDNDEKKSSKITKHQEIEQRREPLSFSRIPAYLLHDDLSPNLDCKNRNRQLEQQFPKIKAATRISFQLNQGEMLYLPASWFHEVTSFSTTNSNQQSFHMALNYWMHPPNTQSYDSPYESNYWHDQWQLLQDAMNKSQIYAQHSTQITSSIVNAQVSHADTRKRIITRKRLKRLQLKNRIIWLTDTLWNAKLDITNKVLDASKGKIDFFNWGFIEPRSVKKNVFFLEECRDWASYEFASEIQLEFRLKYKVSDLTDKEYNKINTKKTQKKFLDYLDAKQYEKLKEEFNRGFDPNFISETGQTPLSLAVLVDDKLQLSTLVDNGALVDFRSADSKTPLHIAAANNKLVALQTLLYYGAWPDCLDAVTLPPLYYAATNGHSDCLHKLCQAKAGLNIIDSGGKTALHQACLGKWLPCVALLIDYGADMNIQNNTGNTALHICASVNAVECAQKLLIRGANKDIINKAGQTPLQFAIIMQSFDIVKFIQKFTLDQIIPPPPPMDSLYLTFRKDERKRVGTLKAPTITSSPSSTVASPNVGSADFHGSNERKSAPPPSLVNMSIFSSTQPPHTASPLSQRDARPISMIDPRSGGYNTGTEMLLPPPLGMFPVDIPGDTIGGGGVALPPLPPPPMFGGDQIAFDPSLLPPPPPTGLPDQFLFQDGNTNFPPPLALPSGIPPMFISAPPPPLPSGYGNDASMQFLPPPPQPNPSETAFDPYSMPFPPPPLPQQQQQQNTVPSHKSAPPPPMLNLDTTSQYGNAPPQPSVVPHDSAAKSNVIVNIISAMSTDAKELLQGLVIENKKMQQEITRLKAKLADMGIREY